MSVRLPICASASSGAASRCACAAPHALLGLRLALAHGRHDHVEDLAIVGIAPGGGDPRAQVGAEGLHLLDRADGAEHGIHVLRGEGLALRRGAGLDQHGTALRRAGGVERPARGEEAALEVDRAHLGGIDEHAALAIHHDRIGIPRLPELGHDLDELVGHLVAQVVLDMRVEAEVLRRALGRRGHEVAAHPALRHQVERGDQAREQIRRIEAGRDRRHEAEPARRLRHQRHQRQRIVLRRPQRTRQVEIHRAAVVVGHEHRILEQQEVEAGALHRPGEIDVNVRLRPVARRRRRPIAGSSHAHRSYFQETSRGGMDLPPRRAAPSAIVDSPMQSADQLIGSLHELWRMRHERRQAGQDHPRTRSPVRQRARHDRRHAVHPRQQSRAEGRAALRQGRVLQSRPRR